MSRPRTEREAHADTPANGTGKCLLRMQAKSRLQAITTHLG